MMTYRYDLGPVKGARWEITKGRVFGGVFVDLWPTRFNVGHEGQTVLHACLEERASRQFRLRKRRKGIFYSAGPTCMGIHGLEVSEVDAVVTELRDVLGKTGFLVPLDGRLP